jgi:hypothetical protein
MATYQENELLALAILVGLGLFLLVLARPQYGIFLFLCTFMFALPDELKGGGGGLSINKTIGLLLFVVLCFQIAREKSIWFLKNPQILLFMAITIVFVLTAILESPRILPWFLRDVDQTGRMLSSLINRSLAFLIFIPSFIRTPKDFKKALGLLSILLLIAVLDGTLNVLTGRIGGGGGVARAASTLQIQQAGNPNYLAFMSLFSIGILWYLSREWKGKRIRNLALVVIPVLILCVFLSASRAGLIGLLFLGAILLKESGVDPKKIIIISLLLIVTAYTVSLLVSERHFERITNISTSTTGRGGRSTANRIETLKAAWELVKRSPLWGVGIGNFVVEKYFVAPHLATRHYTHNSFVWALVEGGIIILTLYLLILWLTFRELSELERGYGSRYSDLGLLWTVKALKTNFLVFLLMSAFADLWLWALFPVFVGFTIVLKTMHLAARQQAFYLHPDPRASIKRF